MCKFFCCFFFLFVVVAIVVFHERFSNIFLHLLLQQTKFPKTAGRGNFREAASRVQPPVDHTSKCALKKPGKGQS